MKTVKLLGWVFILIGILGFVPGITSNGMLLGIFAVDTVHNIVHLLSGIVALMFAAKGEMGAKQFSKIFGIVYGLVAVLGFVASDFLNGILAVNMADNLLHVLLAVIFLAIGFGKGKRMG